MSARKLYTETPSNHDHAAYMRIWRKVRKLAGAATHYETAQPKQAIKRPCECGRGFKVSKAKGCAACEAANAVYESSMTPEQRYRLKNNPLTKYAELAITYMGTGGRHTPVHQG